MFADRVLINTSTTGTGDFALSSAVTGYQSFFSAFGVGPPFYYTCENPGFGEWETGIGVLVGPTQMTRLVVLSSSNSNALVSFGTGSKNLFCSDNATTLLSAPTTAALIARGFGLP